MKARFLDATLPTPSMNLALEESLFRSAEGPVLRTWDNQRSVVLGRAQLAEAETDLEYCRMAGIPVLRRFTAGGTVYNGPGNTNWSFVVPRGDSGSNLAYSRDANRVFREAAALVVEALGLCSVEARFEAPNRIVDGNGGKVSGMSAYISQRASICHGTLLMRADLAELDRVTTPPSKELPRKYPRSRHSRVSNCGVERAEFVGRLASVAGVPSEQGSLKSEEVKLAARLEKERYARREWNLGDPFSLDYS